jgi:replication-associated recombination protein RarA
MRFEPISAVFSGVADLKKVFAAAKEHARRGDKTLLFVDEIHRFNRAQQDSFLPFVEDGTVTLVGATTENPSFELNAALLSRAQVLILHRLDAAALELLLDRAEALTEKTLPLTPAAPCSPVRMVTGAFCSIRSRRFIPSTLASRSIRRAFPPCSTGACRSMTRIGRGITT